MYSRSDNDGRARYESRPGTRHASGPTRMRSDRVHEIRERIVNDAYRSADVAEEIARRILRSRDL
jgi:hypothetical protein